MIWIESLAARAPETWALLLAIAPTLFGFLGVALGWLVAAWWAKRAQDRLEQDLHSCRGALERSERALADERELCLRALHDLTWYRWLELGCCLRLAKVEGARPLQLHRLLRQRIAGLLTFAPQVRPAELRDALFARGVLLDHPALSLPDLLELRPELVERFEAPLERSVSDR